MSRFHIEDIVEQDKHGVVFRALDGESGSIVSIRRFLPFGKEGGGLDKEEAVAFEKASERLADISHVALRAVITGSVDPIDGIPYLVTEWVEGAPLNAILAGESMEPELVIDVLRIALEVSVMISRALGEEGVWVETEVESIVIGTKDSGRGFTFWISPFKWLGSESESRKLSSIVELGEKLTGWKRVVVGGLAASGLGDWLKWLRKNPDAPLAQALEKLDSFTSRLPPPEPAEPIAKVFLAAPPKITPPSKRKPLLIAALILIAAIAGGLSYYHNNADASGMPAADSEGAMPSVADGLPGPEKSDSPAAIASALAKKLSEEAAAKTKEKKLAAKPSTAKAAAAKSAGSTNPGGGGRIFNPDDKELWTAKKTGTPVKLGGVIRKVQTSSTGKSIYLFFTDPPDPGKLAGVMHKSTFKGDFREEAFMPLVGRNVILTGFCFKEPGGRVLCRIAAKGKIKVVD